MRSLVFTPSFGRLAATRVLAALGPGAFVGPLAPIQLREVPRPRPPAPGWVRLDTRLAGICGSDAKQVFLNGALDNPMTALVSFPQVLGHEVVATVADDAASAAAGLTAGQRVVLNPWLSCVTRGLEPCVWCRAGDLAQCLGFTRGALAPGIHHGNSSQAPGGFAPELVAHASQALAVPDDVSDEQAVLADPFSVSFHAVLRNPPPPDGTALVYGCGTLGLLAVAILRLLRPDVRVLAVARFAHQAAAAEALGAARALAHAPTAALVEELARETASELWRPWRGLPMLSGGVDVVFDTVTSPGTLEVAVRVARSRARIVCLGVEIPRRFEWTPLYFKELELVGSNAFGVEELDGRRQHAMEWYLELVRTRALDVTSILTHRFRLEDYRAAFLACFDQGRSGAIKVLFDHRPPR